ALETGEDEVEIFCFESGGHGAGGTERVELVELVVRDVDAAVGAFREGFFNCLLGALGAHRNRNHFATVFFFESQGFFQGVAIWLVGFKADVGFANPCAGFDDGEGGVFRGDLFDAYSDFHFCLVAVMNGAYSEKIQTKTRSIVKVQLDSMSCYRLAKHSNPDAGELGHRRDCLCYLPSHRLKISDALGPPKPKEFESGYLTEALRAWLWT